MEWPSKFSKHKDKAVFFVKKAKERIPSEAGTGSAAPNILDSLACGDIHSNVLGKNTIFYFCGIKSSFFVIEKLCPMEMIELSK